MWSIDSCIMMWCVSAGATLQLMMLWWLVSGVSDDSREWVSGVRSAWVRTVLRPWYHTRSHCIMATSVESIMVTVQWGTVWWWPSSASTAPSSVPARTLGTQHDTVTSPAPVLRPLSGVISSEIFLLNHSFNKLWVWRVILTFAKQLCLLPVVSAKFVFHPFSQLNIHQANSKFIFRQQTCCITSVRGLLFSALDINSHQTVPPSSLPTPYFEYERVCVIEYWPTVSVCLSDVFLISIQHYNKSDCLLSIIFLRG